MIAALILGAYACAVALLVPTALRRFWPSDRAPRLTLVLLQVFSCSFLVAAATSGLALAVTLIEQLPSLSPAIDRCADQLPITEDTRVGALLGQLGLAVSAGLAIRIVYCLLLTFGTAGRRRRAHTRALRMLAVRDDEHGMLVLDHEDPACYCLPGRPGTVVITSGALRRLSPGQLDAVLAHERAHLSGRHHLVVAFSYAVSRSVPGIRLLKYAEQESRRLVELIADDAAARESGPRTVAAALAVIGTGHAPGAALGMVGRDLPPAVARVVRLVGAERHLQGRARALSLVAATAVVMVPLALAGLSLFALMGHCPPNTRGDAAGASAVTPAVAPAVAAPAVAAPAVAAPAVVAPPTALPSATGTAAGDVVSRGSETLGTLGTLGTLAIPSGTSTLRLPDGR